MTAPVTEPSRQTIRVRELRSDDLDALVSGIPELSDGAEQLTQLTALVATASRQEPIGVARFTPLQDGSNAAGIAVAVAPEWRGRGVATMLLSRVAELARAAGVRTFVITCVGSMVEARALVHELGPASVADQHEGLVAVRVELPTRVGYGAPLNDVLRRVAAGRLSVSCDTT